MRTSQGRILTFGEFLLDPAERRLLRRGQPVELQGKPLELLELLLRHAPGLVTRRQIKSSLWPDRVIEYDAAINAAIRDVRHALGDDSRNPQYVETVPRHGYRILPPVTFADDAKVRFRHRLAGAALSAAVLATIVVWGFSMPADDAGIELPVAARQAFVKGEWLLALHEPSAAGRAVSLFEQAVAAEPGYAEAWAALADAHYYRFEQPAVAMPAAEAALHRALALDPDLARAHRRLADVRFIWHWQFNDAESTYQRALELDAGATETYHAYAAFLIAMERPDEAFAHMRRALAIDPLSLVLHGDLAWFYAMAGRHEQALEECAMLLELAPDNRRAIACPLRSLLALGRLDEAAAVTANLMPADVTLADAGATAQLAHYWQWQHDRTRAARAEGRYVDSIHLALTAARRGDAAVAMDWIERARDERSRLFVYLRLFPEFRALHEHPRFIDTALQAASGLLAPVGPVENDPGREVL